MGEGDNASTEEDQKHETGKSDQKDSSEKNSKEESKEDEKKKPKKRPIYKKRGFIITAIIVGVVLVAGAIILLMILSKYVSTDDAYVDGHVVQLSSQVSAPVIALYIDDNQLMHKGDLMLELDPTDYLVALQQAKAQVAEANGRLAQAGAQIESAKASVPEAVANEHAAEASLENAQRNYLRYDKVDPRARTRQQLDNAANTLTNAQARVEQAQAQLTSAQANVATAVASEKAAKGDLAAAQAGQRRAEVNLSYCKIYAPCEGRVTERTVEAGNYVIPGQALCLLVEPDVWITANFKETQLTHMRPGQPVTIKVDAFPGRKFQGHIDSIQAGSGSRFSVLPAENATGNYVKIVQRVPVKITFDHGPNTNDAPMLSPGLSVEPRVTVR